jgi:hypothetical protein
MVFASRHASSHRSLKQARRVRPMLTVEQLEKRELLSGTPPAATHSPTAPSTAKIAAG